MTVLIYSRAGMLGGMEEVLLGSPDDVCCHQAYATALLAQGDDASAARSRLVQTQIKLEGTLSAEERKKLTGRERKLIRDFAPVWLGELEPWLVGRKTYAFAMKRGWLDSVEAPELDADFVAALARAPIARLLRTLTIAHERPGGVAALAPLLDSPVAATLTTFRLGEVGDGEAPADVLRRLVEGN
jgi:hypothetical protein